MWFLHVTVLLMVGLISSAYASKPDTQAYNSHRLSAMPSLIDIPIGGSVEIVFNNTITNLPGKNLVGVLVKYPPGGKSGSHRHAKSAFITAYVLTGAIRSQVDDGPILVYHVGQSWLEAPGAHHKVSENASPTEPASLLATFVLDTHDVELTVFDPPEPM